jgi:hypothetical protein
MFVFKRLIKYIKYNSCINQLFNGYTNTFEARDGTYISYVKNHEVRLKIIFDTCYESYNIDIFTNYCKFEAEYCNILVCKISRCFLGLLGSLLDYYGDDDKYDTTHKCKLWIYYENPIPLYKFNYDLEDGEPIDLINF